ncbi:Mismatch-binding protein cmb1 [Wallemia ichthyophaga EXF-994]|uniref:Mismatch-binding protein cmb1 n=1 Tax=Wallemia ichthyophaga (strain EXF-994 / CBS 113033) TaxID=1299270 RepID=R9AGZ6_WALI9|nr:Mismatch-binding protein cmb1 [Wallemia ichthyophaga EXF-994]EOR01457.1 Mismatch-binding protein cmb1 [Wallemia ichthyophaga EXF-994]
MSVIGRITHTFPLRAQVQARFVSRSAPVFSTKTQDAEKEKARKQLEKEKEKAKKAKDAVKTKLSPPKQAPTAWQLFFIEELDKARQQGKIEIGVISHSASELYKKLTDAEKMPYVEHSKELRAKQAKEFAEYIKSLPYDVLKKENSLRTKLRKQGKKGVQKIRDPNAPKRPLTAYFAYLKDLRDKEDFRQSIFGNDATGWLQSSIIDQSRAASDKWKALSEDVKQTYKDKATEAKKKYEDAKIEYQNSFL